MDIKISTDLLNVSTGLNEVLPNGVMPYYKQALTDMVEVMRNEMPGRTYTMANATDWNLINSDNLQAEIGVDDSVCPYAKYVFGGTKSYYVRPRKEKALQWFVGGQVFYSRGHWMPARKPNPFLVDIFNKHQNEFINTIENGIKTLIEEV